MTYSSSHECSVLYDVFQALNVRHCQYGVFSVRIAAFVKRCYFHGFSLYLKSNTLVPCSRELVWICFTKYVCLDIVCMAFLPPAVGLY